MRRLVSLTRTLNTGGEGRLDQGLLGVESDGINFECGTSREDDGISWL